MSYETPNALQQMQLGKSLLYRAYNINIVDLNRIINTKAQEPEQTRNTQTHSTERHNSRIVLGKNRMVRR